MAVKEADEDDILDDSEENIFVDSSSNCSEGTKQLRQEAAKSNKAQHKLSKKPTVSN